MPDCGFPDFGKLGLIEDHLEPRTHAMSLRRTKSWISWRAWHRTWHRSWHRSLPRYFARLHVVADVLDDLAHGFRPHQPCERRLD